MRRPPTRLVTRSSARLWRAGNSRSDARLPDLAAISASTATTTPNAKYSGGSHGAPEQRVRVVGVAEHPGAGEHGFDDRAADRGEHTAGGAGTSPRTHQVIAASA
jgi:hypothetical protein